MNCALVVDNHPVVLLGCQQVLGDMGVKMIVEATTAEFGYQAFIEHRPDVAIIDLCLGSNELTGLSLIGKIRRHDPNIVIIAFSMDDDPIVRTLSLQAGATVFVPKDSSIEYLVAVCRRSELKSANARC
jgi:two-component system, NarL family, invasion response regulator UvrY